MESFDVLRRHEKKAQNFGEFRTKRLILERYDAMAEAIRTGEPYETIESFAVAPLDAGETRDVTIDDRELCIYTSGSTGTPKGTGVYHRGFANLVAWFIKEFGFNASDRSLLVTSISFDLTQKNLYAVLSVGGALHLAPAGLYDPQAITERIGSCAISRWL